MRSALLAAVLAAGALAAQPQPGAGVISGHVLHALTSAPLRKATVSLIHPDFRLTAETSSEGWFEFTGLPPGAYRLSAARPGFLERRARPIQLAPGARVTDAALRLPPHSVIAGMVIDDDGEPAAHAQVWLHKFSYQPGRGRWAVLERTTTNETGEYRFANLKPGRYLVEARSARPSLNSHFGPDAPVWVPLPVFHRNALHRNDALPVSVGTGEEVRGIDLQLVRMVVPPAVRIRGRVTGAPAGAGLQLTVTLARDSTQPGPPVGSSAIAEAPDYRFELRAPPGRYTLRANVYSGGPEAYAAESIDLTADLDNVVLTLMPAPLVTAQVRLAPPAEAKLEGVTVRLWSLTLNNVSRIQSNSSGRFGGDFDKPLRPGPYVLEVDPDSLPEGCYFHSLLLDGDEISPDEFELRQSGRLEIVLGRNAASLSGLVTDGDGNPLPDAGVTLVALDGKSRPQSRLARDAGRFAFSSLRPGKYQVFAWDSLDDDLWPDPDFRKRHERHATEVELAPGAAPTVTLQPVPAAELK